MPRNLTLKQKRFVDEYVANNGNGSKAARDAGYSELVAAVQAHENLRKPKIVRTIRNRIKEGIDANNITPQDTVNALINEAGLSKDGTPSDSQHGGRVRAIELIGKTQSIFKDVTVNEGPELTGVDAVLKTAQDNMPNTAVGLVIDLCLSPIETAMALDKAGFADIASKVRDLLPTVGSNESDKE